MEETNPRKRKADEDQTYSDSSKRIKLQDGRSPEIKTDKRVDPQELKRTEQQKRNRQARKERWAKFAKRTTEEILADRKKIYGEDLTKASKQCMRKTCKAFKTLQEFQNCRSADDGLQRVCTNCINKTKKGVIDAIKATKIGKCCELCGCENVLCLEYAHYSRDTKSRTKNGKPVEPSNISSMKKFKTELPFMRLLCRNCHADETMREVNEIVLRDHPLEKRAPKALYRRKRLDKRIDVTNQEKLKRQCCQRCELQVTAETCHKFDFDHLPEHDKLDSINVLRHGTLEVLVEEMKKCQLLCKNCHSIVTMERREQSLRQIRLEIDVKDNGNVQLMARFQDPAPKKGRGKGKQPAAIEQKIDRKEVEKYIVPAAGRHVPVKFLKDRLEFLRGMSTLSKVLNHLGFSIIGNKHFKDQRTGKHTRGPVVMDFVAKPSQESVQTSPME